MPNKLEITKEEIEEVFLKLKKDADSSGYNLNNDIIGSVNTNPSHKFVFF